eukprot:5350499-Amphidinium_carterae.1
MSKTKRHRKCQHVDQFTLFAFWVGGVMWHSHWNKCAMSQQNATLPKGGPKSEAVRSRASLALFTVTVPCHCSLQRATNRQQSNSLPKRGEAL